MKLVQIDFIPKEDKEFGRVYIKEEYIEYIAYFLGKKPRAEIVIRNFLNHYNHELHLPPFKTLVLTDECFERLKKQYIKGEE